MNVTKQFLVFRSGFNAANNSSRGARPEDHTQHVATVEAIDTDSAVQAALAQGVTVYNGQGIFARSAEECQAEEEVRAAGHAGQVLVKYWHSTTALESWCSTPEEIDDCLELHNNSYPPEFFDADENELDYESAIYAVGGDPYAEEEEAEEATDA